jgi:hypothetical protein
VGFVINCSSCSSALTHHVLLGGRS